MSIAKPVTGENTTMKNPKRKKQHPVVLHEDTKKALFELKKHPRETFDDTIRRLVGLEPRK